MSQIVIELHFSVGPRVKTVKYTLRGELTGAVCSFKLMGTEVVPESVLRLPMLASTSGSSRSGFIVFASDGKSATYVEVSGRKLGNIEEATRLD